MFRNRLKQTASAIKTISPSLDLFPSKHSTEHAVLRFSFSHLFICVFVCLCVWKSEDTMWVPELDSGHRVQQQAPLSALSPVLFFFLNRKSPLYLLIETKPKYSQYFKIKPQNPSFSYFAILLSVGSTLLCNYFYKKVEVAGGVCKRTDFTAMLRDCSTFHIAYPEP